MTTDQPAIRVRTPRRITRRSVIGSFTMRVWLYGVGTFVFGVPALAFAFTGAGGSLGPVPVRDVVWGLTVVFTIVGGTATMRSVRAASDGTEGEESAAFFKGLRDGEAWQDEIPLYPPHKLYDASGRDDPDSPDAIRLRSDLAEAGRREVELAEQVRRLWAENARLAAGSVAEGPYRPSLSSEKRRTAGRHRVAKGAGQQRQTT